VLRCGRVAPVPPILAIAGLGKTYASGHAALQDVDLEIRRGEIFALLGPNGAGKTTLISVVCGIVTASRGTVAVDGGDLQPRALRAQAGSRAHRARASRPVAVGQARREDHDAFGRHEAAPH